MAGSKFRYAPSKQRSIGELVDLYRQVLESRLQHSQHLHLEVLKLLSKIVRDLDVAEHKDLALNPEPECSEYQEKLRHFHLGVLERVAQSRELFAISAIVSLGQARARNQVTYFKHWSAVASKPIASPTASMAQEMGGMILCW